MDAQQLLEAYISTPGSEGDRYWEPLSRVVGDLVHRSAAKRETGDLEDFEEDCVLAIWTKISALKSGETDGSIDNLEAFRAARGPQPLLRRHPPQEADLV